MPLLSDRNFEQDIKTGVSIVKFASLWNMNSRAFEEQFRQLSEEFTGRAKFLVSDVNANHQLAKAASISVIPTIVIYVEGISVARINQPTKRQLRELVSYYLQKSEKI